MAISSFDDFLSCALRGKYQKLVIQKLLGSTSTNRLWYSTWIADGTPTTGSYGAVGLANGRVCNQSTSGAINFATASIGKQLYLLNCFIVTNTASSVLSFNTLVDRISDCTVLHSSSTGTITGLDATSRLGSTGGRGDGAQIFIEVQSTFSAASNSFQIQYTNQNGVSGRLTPVFSTVAARGNGNCATNSLYIPLQVGDTGVRSIQAITQSPGTATGQMTICLVKQLYENNIPIIGVGVSKDTITDIHQLPIIYNDACLMFMNITHTGGGNRPVYYELTFGEF